MARFVSTLVVLGICAGCDNHMDKPKKEIMHDRRKLFPYLVTEDYPRQPLVERNLGHKISIQLVWDQGNMCTNAKAEELEAIGITPDQAHTLALENLLRLVESSTFSASRFDGPKGRPFILWGGHWLSATCILLPYIRKWAMKNLSTNEICASIPARGSLLLFPKSDKVNNLEMRQLIRSKEDDSEKKLTWELFSLTPTGPTPLVE